MHCKIRLMKQWQWRTLSWIPNHHFIWRGKKITTETNEWKDGLSDVIYLREKLFMPLIIVNKCRTLEQKLCFWQKEGCQCLIWHIIASNFDKIISIIDVFNTFLGTGMIQKYSYKRHSLLRNLTISGRQSYGCKMTW